MNNFLMLSSALPSSKPNNAGARYIQWVVEYVSDNFEIMVVAPEGIASRRAIISSDVPPHVLIGESKSSLVEKIHTSFKYLSSLIAPASQPWTYAYDILRNRSSREAIRHAQIIDLQWQEQGSLIPIIRRLNPQARIVCTFHDVLSQKFERAQESSDSYSRRVRWGWATAHARRSERAIMHRSDAVVVFSSKDAKLLPQGTAEIHIVVPPIAEDLRIVTRDNSSLYEVLFVGTLWRWENEDGLLWFLREVWPLVKRTIPTAVFRIAGDGASPELLTASQTAGVEILGFVQNLIPLYESAAVVVAPLRLGAGVKFKVVDALSAGVPVVTTRIGAEGIGDASLFAGLSDDPHGFSQAVIESITEPGIEKNSIASKKLRQYTQKIYGTEQFKESISRVYSPPRTQDVINNSTEEPTTRIVFHKIRDVSTPLNLSVVIPVYNGAATLADQLKALATQATTVPFELVISDNGSTDDTQRVATSWADQFAALKIIDSSQIQGAGHARNEGILGAVGDRVLFCDSDDIACPNWVESLNNSLEEFDIVGGSVRLDRINTVAKMQGQLPLSDGLNSIFNFLPYALAGCFAVRKDAFLSVGGFDSSYVKAHEEADLSWRMQLAGFTLGWCPEAIVDYRQRNDFYSTIRQNFNYAESSIFLWCRFSGENTLAPVSFRGSIGALARAILSSYKLIRTDSRPTQARTLGWAAGVVGGHLKYRILGSLPKPITMDFKKSR